MNLTIPKQNALEYTHISTFRRRAHLNLKGHIESAHNNTWQIASIQIATLCAFESHEPELNETLIYQSAYAHTQLGASLMLNSFYFFLPVKSDASSVC